MQSFMEVVVNNDVGRSSQTKNVNDNAPENDRTTIVKMEMFLKTISARYLGI